MPENSRLLVIGLDGANRDILLKGINNGYLSNMAELASEGDISTLKAPLPPTTPVSMSSILTGMYPDSHGVFGFERNPLEEGGYVNYNDIEGPTLFDILGEEGKKAVSINAPMTGPPPEIDGKIVSGFPVSSGNFAWPPPLNKKLRDSGYRIEPASYGEGRENFVQDVFDLADKRFELAKEMVDGEWELFLLWFTGDARLQHFIDDEELIMDFYGSVDDYLGEILRIIDDDVEVMVVSDHGFTDLEVEFDIGIWLSEEGFVDLDRDVNWSKLYGEIEEVDAEPGVVPGGAYMGNLYVNTQISLDNIIEALEEVEYRGERVFRDVFRTEELYGGSQGPELIPVPRRGVNYVVGSDQLFNEDVDEMRSPDREGVVITGFTIGEESPESVDILPTFLDVLDIDAGGKDGGSFLN